MSHPVFLLLAGCDRLVSELRLTHLLLRTLSLNLLRIPLILRRPSHYRIDTEETQPLSPRAPPLSPDYTQASPYYTPDTLHLDEVSEPMEASKTWTASLSGSTSPLSPDHPLTQTSPTPTPS
ncbi:hypothetical protein Tco_1216979 [Tanacetum coccineum]